MWLDGGAWWFLLGIIWAYYIVLYLCVEIAVTNRKLIGKYGVIAVNSFAMELDVVDNIETNISLLGRILGYGTVYAGSRGGKKLAIPRLADPERFKRELYRAMENVRR